MNPGNAIGKFQVRAGAMGDNDACIREQGNLLVGEMDRVNRHEGRIDKAKVRQTLGRPLAVSLTDSAISPTDSCK